MKILEKRLKVNWVFFDGLAINTSGLALERLKLDTISANIANVNTNTTADGGPYKSSQFYLQKM